MLGGLLILLFVILLAVLGTAIWVYLMSKECARVECVNATIVEVLVCVLGGTIFVIGLVLLCEWMGWLLK